MKKKFLLKGLLVSFMLLCAAHTWAYDFEVNNIQYTIISLDDLTVEVSRLTDTNVTELVIYGKVEYNNRTLTVTTIGSKAFQSNITLESVVISDTITTIDSYAFDGCTELKDLTLGNGMTSIGDYAFQGCKGLLSLVIPNSVTSWGSYTFSGCTNLADIIFSDGLTSIGSYAFQGCTSLTEVTIPKSVTDWGSYAFYNCTSLANVIFSDGLISIGDNAFKGCSSLTEVTIPNSVTRTGSGTFWDCSNLVKVTMSNSVTSIYPQLFKNCSNLVELNNVPSSLTSIGQEAFYKCSNLTDVTFPESVTSIGSQAFYNCSSLKEIPEFTSSIGEEALVGCTSLESITIGADVNYVMESYDSEYFSSRGHPYTYVSAYNSLLTTRYPSKMKSIILIDGTSSFSMRGTSSYTGSTPNATFTEDITAKNGIPIFSKIAVEYFYIGRPLIDITSWDFYSSYVNSTLHSSMNVTQPYGTIGTLEIGGYCTDVPYFYQSIENLILGEDVETYTVKNIYQGKLTSITCKSTTPPALTGTFDTSTYVNTILYVPKGCKTTYESTEGWKDFWDIIEADVSGIDDIENSREVTEIGRYTVSGQKITTPQKGINIVRYSDGTARKILVQ